ncbi:MAG: 30S ribosomal protein S8 [Flavobacteriales bacterium]|nr:30S ribosomal protein S8 [Flavobacteriales bacterium]MCX7768031.1 30S ribosomal protein S8 [Flavobacteriales bacterium]MDW8409236.1 30S ribosomal protein S8 [Flavobacteriales bacterium]
MDTIADFLTKIRNASKAGHLIVEDRASKLKKNITKILFDQGYIANYKFLKTEKGEIIKIALKYHPITKVPVIRGIKRVSTPGRRVYVGVDELPRVLNGLGIAVISTSKGIMTDKMARELRVGGEVLCYVY